MPGPPEAQRQVDGAADPDPRTRLQRNACRRASRWMGPPRQRSAPLSATARPRPLQRLPGPLSRRARAGRSPRRARTVSSPCSTTRRATAPLGGAGRCADHVGAVVHPVAEIDVEVARFPEHDRGAGGGAAKRVRRRVVAAAVGLDLDDAGANLGGCPRPGHDQSPHQVGSDIARIARQEPARQVPRYRRTSAPQRNRSASAIVSCTPWTSSPVRVRSAAR